VDAADQSMRFRAVAEPATLRRLRAELTEFLCAAGASDDLGADVTLAVSEAANNVLTHAYQHRAQPGALIVVATATATGIRVAVSDEGSGLAPRADSPGAGLGLPMMAQLAHGMRVDRPADGGTRVELTWRRAS
jgi:anti-sigma regulatory factor (Ser/Thr protein kinase)